MVARLAGPEKLSCRPRKLITSSIPDQGGSEKIDGVYVQSPTATAFGGSLALCVHFFRTDSSSRAERYMLVLETWSFSSPYFFQSKRASSVAWAGQTASNGPTKIRTFCAFWNRVPPRDPAGPPGAPD